MDRSLFYPSMRVVFHCHSFLSVISCDILKDFLLSQWLTIFTIACQPESWSLRVEIICNTKIILSNPDNLRNSTLLWFFFRVLWFFLIVWLGKHIFIITIVNIYYIIILCFLVRRDNLHWFIVIININNIVLSILIFVFWIGCFYPSVSCIFFKIIGIIFVIFL